MWWNPNKNNSPIDDHRMNFPRHMKMKEEKMKMWMDMPEGNEDLYSSYNFMTYEII